MICTKCGTEFDDSASVCPKCGTYCGQQPSSGAAGGSKSLLDVIKNDPKKKTIAIAVGIPVIVLILVLLIIGISKPKGTELPAVSAAPQAAVNPFIGTWSYNTGEAFFNAELVLTFKEDKTVEANVSFFNAVGTYSYKGDDKSGTLELNIEGVGSYGIGAYSYTVGDGTISLSDGTQTIVFKRAEQVNDEEEQFPAGQ